MFWFLPLSVSVGVFGTHTASVERRSRGGRWRIDSILLAVLAWAPTAIWFAACCVGSSY